MAQQMQKIGKNLSPFLKRGSSQLETEEVLD